MRKLETALAVILAAAGTPAMAAQTAKQAQAPAADTSGGQNLEQMSNSAFSRWDSNGDNRLRGDEFAAGLHGAWAGDNNQVDETAFNENWNNWFNAERPDFADLDNDGNRQLSEQELQAALADTNLSGPWQGADDSYLTPEEFRNGISTVGDRDRSGQLDRSEMDTVVAIIGVLVPDQATTAATNQRENDQQRQKASGGAEMTQDPSQVRVGEIIALNDWNTDNLYQNGWSAEALFDRQVFGSGGEEIGNVEDLIIGSNGELLALIAEVGGFWDIGDTHVSVPWDQVTFRDDGAVSTPVTEDNADNFSILNEPGPQALQERVVSNMADRELGQRAWRASELIGDIARIRGGQGEDATQGGSGAGEQAGARQQTGATAGQNEQAQSGKPQTSDMQNRSASYRGYGYVSDLIFKEGRVAAAVVDRDSGYGTRGRYAYPYYGYNHGWTPGSRYYDLPYNRAEAVTITPFNYERLNDS